MDLMQEINQRADEYEPPVEEHVMTNRMLSAMNPKKKGESDALLKDIKAKGEKIKSKGKDLMSAMKSARKKNNWK